MSRKLTVYFSASGVTANAAKLAAKETGSDLYEIQPAVPYTEADLDWTDRKSRSTIEMNNRSSRPEIMGRLENLADYDVIYLGFPIWWYREPSIIDTFLEQYDFSGKTIVLFATSGSSGFGRTAAGLKGKVASDAKIIEGKVFTARASDRDVISWARSLKI